ncbi:MAG: DUF1501 domain-containing protein [Planctomycetota bacterium]|nr:DUF1501 domain-containing protein [Planctomycetota bacterium]
MADPESHRLEHLLRTETFPLRPPPGLNLIRVGSRRWFLETGLGALAGLSVPAILGQQARADDRGHARRPTSVILFWLSGGPSHIDMWDPKPEAPREVRGPFGTIATKIPGVRFSEHLPLQASLLDRLTVIRSVDCRASDHTPITLQAGNPLARRTNDGKDGGGYPSMGSVAAKFRGPNHPHLPPFVGLANSWQSDVWGAGHMGRQYEPVKGKELRGRLGLPQGIHIDRLRDRDVLRRQLDTLRGRLDGSEAVARSDRFTQQAYDMVTSGKARRAFDLEEERASTRDAYGRHSLGEKALLARRLVEAGVTFVLVSGAWGTFDHHGDEVRWGGIVKGLKPLLPRVDRTLFTLVNDLQTRGLLDTTLVLMLGEFGRSPRMTKTAGRGHWQNVMSMVVAGGGLRHGQVIGGTDRFGGEIQNRPVSPSDLAATVYRHLGIDPGAHWTDPQGRPVPIVTQGGRPIAELF